MFGPEPNSESSWFPKNVAYFCGRVSHKVLAAHTHTHTVILQACQKYNSVHRSFSVHFSSYANTEIVNIKKKVGIIKFAHMKCDGRLKINNKIVTWTLSRTSSLYSSLYTYIV